VGLTHQAAEFCNRLAGLGIDLSAFKVVRHEFLIRREPLLDVGLRPGPYYAHSHYWAEEFRGNHIYRQPCII
jgi:hypothetical protein